MGSHFVCEHGVAWSEHCPDGCPDVDADGRILDPVDLARTALRMHEVRELAAAQGLDPANLFPAGPGAISAKSPPCEVFHVERHRPSPARGAKAQCEVRDTLRVSILLRPPLKGECGYWVTRDATHEAMLQEVLSERDSIDAGAWGFGWRADHDYSELDPTDPESRCITVVVEEVSSEAGKPVLL